MGIPLNLIHFYIGAPVLAYLAIHGLFFTKDKQNVITRYLAYGATFFFFAALLYALPVLFTHDSSVLTLTIIIADIFQYASLACVGFLATRLSLSRWPIANKILNAVVLLMTGIYISISIHENLKYPTYVLQNDSGLTLRFVSSHLYDMWNGIAYSSFIFVGVSFLFQIRQVQRMCQRYRIAAFGIFFLVIGLLFAAVPIFGLDIASTSITFAIALAFILMGVLLALSLLSARRDPKV